MNLRSRIAVLERRRGPGRTTVFVPPTPPTPKQLEFLEAPERHVGLVAGVGSGKTHVGVCKALMMPAGSHGMIVAPTYPMLRDSTLRTFLEIARGAGVLRSFYKVEMKVTLTNGTTALFRSGDDPDRLRGPNLGWFWLDEAALLAGEVWQVMLGRLREAPGVGWATSTPRGKNWLWRTFAGREGYRLIRASSKDNQHLPAEFVAELERSYSDLFRRQEVEGEFVDDSADRLIPGEWLDLCERAVYKPAGPTRLAIDLGGGTGGDRTVLLVRDDNGILALEHSRSWSLEDTARRASALVARHRIAPQRVTFDRPGIGYDFKNRLEAVALGGAIAYVGGGKGGAKYANMRSAAAWLARQRLDPHTRDAAGQVQPTFSIPPHVAEVLRDELAALRWTINNDRKIALEKKEDMVAQLGYSPDAADAFVQSFAYLG